MCCSCKEFRTCLSKMGYFITDEEFDLINRTYPHHDYSQEKGISKFDTIISHCVASHIVLLLIKLYLIFNLYFQAT